MKTRKEKISPAEQAIAIDTVALCFSQYFNLKDMYTYSQINTSTATVIQKFIQSTTIKKNMELSKKINQSLQDDAKKMLNYPLIAKTKEESKDIQTMLTKIADGVVDKKLLNEIKSREWVHQSKTQEACLGISGFTAGSANDYLNHLNKSEAKIKENDVYILLLLYGLSGISYVTNWVVGAFNSYFYKQPQVQFKERLEFIAKNLDKDPEDDKDNNDNNKLTLSK